MTAETLCTLLVFVRSVYVLVRYPVGTSSAESFDGCLFHSLVSESMSIL